jgi:hypothetical protein
LVPNPSFEIYSSCPNSTGELALRTNYSSWHESPDFFHECNNELTGWAGVPSNLWGYQYPISGQAYAALYTFADTSPDAREYIAIELEQPLIEGQTYYIFFYASQIEGETATEPMEFRCATNHIGLRFFKDPSYDAVDNPFTPDNLAHLDYSEILADSDNWTKIEGWFTADDDYNWVALGNFFNDGNTEIEIQNDYDRCFGVYFIENICVATDPADCDYLLGANNPTAPNALTVFPNPGHDIINLRSNNLKRYVLSVYDNLGKLIHHEITKENNRSIDISQWKEGIYLIVVADERNSMYSYKYVKQ